MIRVKGLFKRYGEREVLSDVDLTVERGEMFGFIGANGAGKSTTMRIIMGVLSPTAGEVTWRGEPLTRETRRRFGYMPEERGLYQKMRVSDQVAHFGELYGMDAPRARRVADDLIERLELTKHRDDEVQALSLGNQQRAQLAVALVHDPEFLVLDEPFSGLDPVGIDALAQILAELRERGVGIMFSSHQLELVERLIDSVGIIDGGRMLAAGPVDDVRSSRTQRRLRLQVDSAPPGWEERLPGRVVQREDESTVVLDPEGHSTDDVLAAAGVLGSVQHLAWVRPTLADIFREVIA